MRYINLLLTLTFDIDYTLQSPLSAGHIAQRSVCFKVHYIESPMSLIYSPDGAIICGSTAGKFEAAESVWGFGSCRMCS